MSNLNTFTSPRIFTSLKFVTSPTAPVLSIVATSPASSETLTLPDPGGSDSFAYLGLAQTISNKTFGTNWNAGGFKLTNLATPTSSTDAANKGYCDGLITGLDLHDAVQCATTGALPSCTYSGTPNFTLTATANGVLTIDGYSPVLNDRVLVKNQATQSNNGIYVLTTVGTGSVPFVLTRATDYDTSAMISTAAFVFVQNGTANGEQGWVATQGTGATLDTTSITFTQFTGTGAYSQGNGINIASNVISAVGDGTTITVGGGGISVSSTYAGNTSISSVGTITTGTWSATAIATTKGGTGATSAAAGFNNLSPVTTTGDLIIGNGSNSSTRLGIGSNNTSLTSNGTTASWNLLAAANFATVAADSWFGNATGSTATPAFNTSPVPTAMGGTGSATTAGALTNLGAQPLQQTITTASGTTHTQVVTDLITQYTTGASACAMTLVAVSSSNKGIVYTITKVDSGTGVLTISPASGTINGAASVALDFQYDSIDLYNDGTNWWLC
jgi:hypothetical protein